MAKGGAGRSIIEVKDFSGGQVTRPPEKGLDTRYSPDCLNVYSEGLIPRRRDGYTVVNATAAVGTANGFYNWARSATVQNMIVFFGSTLSKIDVVSGAWDGILDTVSNDSANGTAFSSSIMHFVTYNGTLIMTNEARDKPQYMRVTDTSHFNIEYLGAGTGPQGKYCQVWKNHLWILNIGQGGTLTEDCDSITNWTDNDTGTGDSTQTTFSGSSTFRFLGGTNSGDSANRQRTVSGGLTDDYTIEMRTYFAMLTSTATGNIAACNFRNGVINNQARWSSSDGIQVNDGTNWNQVGVNLATQSTFAIWKFIVTGGTATAARVDILKDGSYIGLQYPLMAASTASDGQINLQALSGATTSRCDWYLDYLYINSSTPVTDRISNGGMETWGGGLPSDWNVYPTQALVHYRCNDNAANTTVTNNGTEAASAVSYASATTVNTSVITNASGKISRSFTFTSSSTHHIRMATTTVTSMSDDSVGTFTWWAKFDGSTESNMLFFGETNNRLLSRRLSSLIIDFNFNKGGAEQWVYQTSAVSSNAFVHIGLVQNGTTPIIYVNGLADTSGSFTVTTDKTAWFSGSGTVMDTGWIGRSAGAGQPPHNGDIDDFRYYSTALSSLEIQSIYAEGNGNEAIVGVVQEGTTTKLGSNSLRLNSTGEYSITSQVMSAGSALAGVSSIVGVWAFVTNSATYKIRCTAGTTNFDSAVLTGNGTWQYQTLNFTPTSGASSVGVQLITTSSATAYFDHVSVIATSTGIITDNSDRAQRSAIDTYNDWSGTDSGTNDLITSGDIGITGSFILNDRMYVTKAWSIHRFSYTQSSPLIDIKQVKKTVGTKSPRSIKNVDIPEGEIVIFLGTDKKLYLFDGLISAPVSDEMSIDNGISSVYFDNINSDAFDKVFAIVDQSLNHYKLYVPLGGSTVPDYVIVYDYLNKAFWPWQYNDTFSAGDISDDGAGLRAHYALTTSTGRICLLNSGASDNGTAIDSRYTTTKIGVALKLNRIDEVEIETPSQAAAPTITWRGDYESSYVATQSIASGTNSHIYAPGRIDNLIQFRIADNTTTASWKLWAITLTERLVGVGK